MISFQFFVVLFLLIIVLRILQKRDFNSKIRQFRNCSLIESVQVLLSTKGSPAGTFRVAHEWLNKYGCFAFWSGIDTYVFTGKREDAQIMFNMRQKGDSYHFLKPLMGNGILTSSGEKWKKSRTILESVYGAKELSTNFIQIFNEQSRRFIDEIQKEGLGVTHNFWPLMFNATSRMNSETTIGSGDLQLPQGYGSIATSNEKLLMKRLYSPWLYPDFIFSLYLFLTNQSEDMDASRTHFVKAIKMRKHLTVENDFEVSETSTRPRTVVLDILMKKDLSDEDSVDELMSLMAGGTGTVATGISFTLLMLAMNPIVQNKVLEELNLVFPDDEDTNIQMSDLHKLIFLEKCLRESLRKLSIIPIIERHVTSETTLSDGRVVPVGVNLVLSIWNIHNNPEYYPNPEVWNPHNFDEDAVAKRPINTFLPFAMGARQCIGHKYAMMSMKIFLARILRNFKVTTDQTEAEVVHYVTARCKSGYYLKFEKR